MVNIGIIATAPDNVVEVGLEVCRAAGHRDSHVKAVILIPI